jgi:hypothetical protein
MLRYKNSLLERILLEKGMVPGNRRNQGQLVLPLERGEGDGGRGFALFAIIPLPSR